jgi:eukaryotic-like serine/threonine-protein kinase
MGQVWAAHDTVLGRDVAVKVQRFDPEGDRVAFERFVREARTTAALQHPNVVTIFDSGTDAGLAFLVMELLTGPTLAGYLAQRGPLPEPEAVDLGAQITSGLAAAHAVGVVHRDLKPANVMFDAHGTLKILDFGIAHLAQTAAARLTATNTIIGSPPYLSPEQLQGHRADERSDLYALGCVMTTMLTGRPPFEGEHALALAYQHLHAGPPRVRERRPEVDPSLDSLVAQLLSKSPSDRPRSAREVLERLTRRQPGSPATDATMSATLVVEQPTSALPSDPAEASWPEVRPRQRSTGRWIAAGAGLLTLLVAVLVAAVIMADDPVRNEPGAAPDAPTSTASSPPPANPTTPAPPDASSTRESLQEALSDLRAVVRAVSRGGQIEAKKAEELGKRVDELAKHLAEKRGEDADKKVEDLDKYVMRLSAKGELTPAGEQQISRALQRVRELVAAG